MTTIIIIIVVVVVVILLVAVVILFNKRSGGGGGAARGGGAKQSYENPTYAQGQAATPDWADPNVPFLSRPEAEAKLRQGGNVNGSYVVRQSTSVIRGYVITAVWDGKTSNSQLKYQNGSLQYGSAMVGSTLREAIRSLQTSVKVAPSGVAPYFLTTPAGQAAPPGGYLQVGGPGAAYDDADADA